MKVKTDTPKLVKYLMPFKMGVVYNHITESEVDREKWVLTSYGKLFQGSYWGSECRKLFQEGQFDG